MLGIVGWDAEADAFAPCRQQNLVAPPVAADAKGREWCGIAAFEREARWIGIARARRGEARVEYQGLAAKAVQLECAAPQRPAEDIGRILLDIAKLAEVRGGLWVSCAQCQRGRCLRQPGQQPEECGQQRQERGGAAHRPCMRSTTMTVRSRMLRSNSSD